MKIKRVKGRIKRPNCAGFHEAGKTCDGDREDKKRLPCSYREQCLAIISKAGGANRGQPERIAKIASRLTEHELWVWTEHCGQRPPVFQPDISASKRSHRTRKRLAKQPPPINLRPDDVYGESLSIMDAIVERFARETHKVLVAEDSEALEVGDLFIRYMPLPGRLCRLYEAVKTRRKYHRCLAKFQLHRRSPTCNFLTNQDGYEAAHALRPPSGLSCVPWKDVNRDWVTVKTVGPRTAINAGMWFARCYKADLIQGKV